MTSDTSNHWPQAVCARAYWSQREMPAYQELLAHTRAWTEPGAGERWVDLGCGGGPLTRALWQDSGGQLAAIVAIDCAAENEKAYCRLRAELRPRPVPEQIRFLAADFHRGLSQLSDGNFDGIVSGLSIQYAESRCPQTGRWTSIAYDQLLAGVWRVLRPGGRFVFSVNVPDPDWSKVGRHSLTVLLRSSHPVRFLLNGLRMWRYGNWVKLEAARGRFHYLPANVVTDKLRAAGFEHIEHRLSYAEQAFVFRCFRPE
jgi:SAM-dependent methyltransferase